MRKTLRTFCVFCSRLIVFSTAITLNAIAEDPIFGELNDLSVRQVLKEMNLSIVSHSAFRNPDRFLYDNGADIIAKPGPFSEVVGKVDSFEVTSDEVLWVAKHHKRFQSGTDFLSYLGLINQNHAVISPLRQATLRRLLSRSVSAYAISIHPEIEKSAERNLFRTLPLDVGAIIYRQLTVDEASLIGLKQR